MSKLVWWPFIIAYVSSIVLGQPSVDAPYTVTKGETTTLGWSGESESLKISYVSSFSDVIAAHQYRIVLSPEMIHPLPLSPLKLGRRASEFSNTSGHSTPSITANTQVAAAVHDVNGEGARSALVPVIA
ncbi:uncharacterized protein EV420DRAFT_1645168 [Desarmillaria tabescens]|uniref:Uncharacterized protein n=1 Tax=Armillaria tabescens TaxID=1929756 RepID=A0AA39K8P3_ARMTA|nr:uncharacterized protein EV420DRAFT_1645168 [Desarmillaria tabescens]KAK0454273.1 hypothetical protein EV420DRAFT_1645168 [Desarmillaria tabescens]